MLQETPHVVATLATHAGVHVLGAGHVFGAHRIGTWAWQEAEPQDGTHLLEALQVEPVGQKDPGPHSHLPDASQVVVGRPTAAQSAGTVQ